MAAVDFALKPFEQFPVQETCFFHSDKEEDQSPEYSATVPTFDIWKKFELLPTPPRSPSRSEQDSPIPFDLSIDLEEVTDTLEIVTEIADDSSQATTLVGAISTRSLKSKLIQDCMWNGSSYEPVDLKIPAIEDYYDTPCSTPPPVEYVSSECVDPSAVFPYPMNDTQICGSQHCSDSEEEIDVVSIEKPKKRCLSEGSDHRQVPAKRIKPAAVRAKSITQTHATAKITKRQISTASSNSGSDEEDYDKRATHNVLERKRRNDLKTSFHSLRDEVPDIKDNERAPKVTILKKAKDHIEELINEEVRLLAELKKEKDRNKQLQDKFYSLGQKRK